MKGFMEFPSEEHYWLLDATVPASCLVDWNGPVDADGLSRVDIEVKGGRIESLMGTGDAREHVEEGAHVVYLDGSICWPTMVDLHTHIDKSHTYERSRNLTGTLSGADTSTARDSNFWDLEDVQRRMDFSIQCAYAHGTSALRTHLINLSEKQKDLTWRAFSNLRSKWAGKVEIQGVALVVLSYFRDMDAGRCLAETVKKNGGVLGAAVCCSEKGGLEDDEWTTCPGDREELLDRIFKLAKEFDLDLDFHTDENGNEESKGLRDICKKSIQHNYQGRVVCGHCCSLSRQSPEDLEQTLQLAAKAGVTVVSLPLVNEWLQDRSTNGTRTPRWRGVTALLELRQAGVKTALASDNTRDQFYAYGDLDMLDVYTQSVRIGHLDCPHTDWPCSVTSVPADAMHLNDHGRIGVGLGADLVVFRARKYSELLSRPQHDRVVVRDGVPIPRYLPCYQTLDSCKPAGPIGPARYGRKNQDLKAITKPSTKIWFPISQREEMLRMVFVGLICILGAVTLTGKTPMEQA
ncbi:hypothetical protein BSKO_10397 [Bryopsis sp. KO-2023]|nr:hypothetical protein BSKO_10397 [Bryopsis sp. KO-2023]